MKIPFSPPDISELEINEVISALKSGWITTGPRVKLFEKKIAEYCHSEKAVCLSSATAALELTLHILGIGPGDEVITSAYTYTASASVVCHIGAKLILIDTSPDSYEMNYDMLSDAITEKTKAIIPVDIAGIVCDYDKIFNVVESKKLLFKPNNKIQSAIGRVAVIADAAHSFGATWHCKTCGEIADFTSFSFHAVKNITTAEGGAVVWKNIDGINNEYIYHEYQLLSLHGQSKDALAKTKLGSWEYDIVYTAYKCNMTDIMAAIGLKQFERYKAMLTRRQEIIKRYDTAFKPLGVQVLNHIDKNHCSSGHLYLTRIPGISVEQRNDIILRMAENAIACNVHYKPLPMHTAYKNLGFSIDNYPNAYKQFANEISLPLNTCLTDEEIQYVIDIFINLNIDTKLKDNTRMRVGVG